jgi:glycerophosphoryl diester phosphodiesterase
MAGLSVEVIAHRGASAAWPENSLEAFTNAVVMGADWVELDVRRSADDVLVVHHDAHIDGRAIVDHPYTDLPDTIPTLAEALDACTGAKVNIEIKNDPDDPDYDAEHQISDAVVGLALAFRDPSELLFSSFNVDTVRRIRAVNSELAAALVTGVLVMDVGMLVDRVVAYGFEAIHPWEHTLDSALVGRAHDAGLAVRPWTVDTRERMVELVSLGVDALITNHPDVARQVVDELERPDP